MAEAPGTHDPSFLPPDIPVPQDDGRARHLTGSGRVPLMIEGDDGTGLDRQDIAAALAHTGHAAAGPAAIDHKAVDHKA